VPTNKKKIHGDNSATSITAWPRLRGLRWRPDCCIRSFVLSPASASEGRSTRIDLINLFTGNLPMIVLVRSVHFDILAALRGNQCSNWNTVGRYLFISSKVLILPSVTANPDFFSPSSQPLA